MQCIRLKDEALLLLCLQGEWKPKQIDNPNYKGVWVHPEIDNPEYTQDSEIYKFDSVGVLGLDLWQVDTNGYLLVMLKLKDRVFVILWRLMIVLLC